MRITKTVQEIERKTYFSNDCFVMSDKPKRVGKTAQELWKESGKSVHLTGADPREALNRMQSDRLDGYGDILENTAWVSYNSGNMGRFDELMSQVQQVRALSEKYRRASRGEFGGNF